MSRICLIRPPRVGRENSFSTGLAIPPIGMAYLCSSLKAKGYVVTPIDAIGECIDQSYRLKTFKDVFVQGMTIEQIIAMIPKDCLFIGVSCMFSCEWFLYEDLINEIKKVFPRTPIVVGGEHVTAEAENVLKVCPAVDVCVPGEGEATIVELAEAFEQNRSLLEIAGLVLRESNKIIVTPKRERVVLIDNLPQPDWSQFPIQAYLQKGYGVATVKRRSMPVLASRGCPYKCTFCSSPQMWGTSLHLRTPQLVVEEIKQYKEMYGIEHVDFVDLVGFLNRAWVKEVLTLMIEADLGVTWMLGAGTRSEILDEEILTLFKKSNVLRIFYAPESGSKETLKRIKKRVNLDKMIRSMKMANRMGISMRAPVIYGFPEQTIKEAFQSLFFSFKLSYIGVDDVVAHAFSAYPGSELFNQLVKEGAIDVDQLIATDEYNNFMRSEVTTRIKNLKSWSKSLPDWSLGLFQYGGMSLSYMILFLCHPLKFVRMIKRIFIQRKPLTLLDLILFNLFFGTGKL